MTAAKFAPGFRLSALDVVVLVLGFGASVFLGALFWWVGILIAFVVGHFFLFCNVFRLSRPPELVWAGVFVTAAGATIVWDVPGWMGTMVISLCMTVLVVALEMRKPSYHGVGWQRINPGLPDWWHVLQRTHNSPDVSDKER